MLFTEILPAKGEPGLNQVVDILLANKFNELANQLNGGRINNIDSVSSFLNPQIREAQSHLFRLIKENIDFMAKHWSDLIRVAKTHAAFVEVQVLEQFRSENGASVHSYEEVFRQDENTIHKHILIQADPGCGKTTYVNKLALDWANQDEYLMEKFDFIFLIALRTLTMNVEETIKRLLPKQSRHWFQSYSESSKAKILLIFDGFDELAENSPWYYSVLEVLNGESEQFQFCHVIVTTRRSHVDSIPQDFRGRSLLIKGFDEHAMKLFLDKQHVPLPSIGEQLNLHLLLQTPLFCAIYCSLYSIRGHPIIELEDSYDLIKSLVENSVGNTQRMKKIINVENQLGEIGKFAFHTLDSHSMNFVSTFCRSTDKAKPVCDLSTVKLDLLIKRIVPTAQINRFKEEFTFPHQLIAEYLAARYFARSLTKEQLVNADATALHLLTPHDLDPLLNLPFVQFFTYELLLLYLEKKYEESVFDNLFSISELRFIWNGKSTRDVPALDHVNALRFSYLNAEIIKQSWFFRTLYNCKNLSSLTLFNCKLSKDQVNKLVTIVNIQFEKLTNVNLGGNVNVGSTPELFTALSKCKYLETLELWSCKTTVDSINELTRCIDEENGFANLRELDFSWNGHIGSSGQFLVILHKCRNLQKLNLEYCSITNESLNAFLSTFNATTFQHLVLINLYGNDFEVEDKFYVALENCPNISKLRLSKNVERALNEIGRNAKENLKERGCKLVYFFLGL